MFVEHQNSIKIGELALVIDSVFIYILPKLVIQERGTQFMVAHF